MIQDKALPRKSPYELRCNRKMLGINQEVVGKIEFFQYGNAAQKIGLKQEVVRLALDNVANPYKFCPPRKRLQLGTQLWRTQIDPAYDSENEGIVFGHFQEPAGFFQRLPA